MTDAERELLARLVAARWPLAWQLAAGVAVVAGYWAWARAYYAVVDPALRRRLGRRLGAEVVWVHRHTASYPTPLESGLERYARWTWGIARQADRTWRRDLAAVVAGTVASLAAGVTVPLLLVWAFVGPRVLSYAVFFPAIVAVLGLLAAWFGGRRAVAGMR